jgi:hypothetical protein
MSRLILTFLPRAVRHLLQRSKRHHLWGLLPQISNQSTVSLDLGELAGVPNTFRLPRHKNADTLRHFRTFHAMQRCCIPPWPSDLASEFDNALTLGRLEANGFRSNRPLWALSPRFCRPTCKMDYLVHTLMHQGRHSTGAASVVEFTRPDFPSVGSLLNPVVTEVTDKENTMGPKTIEEGAEASAHHIADAINVPTMPEKIAVW